MPALLFPSLIRQDDWPVIAGEIFQRASMDPSLASRVWDVILAACGMIRKGFSKHKAVMEVHLLLKRWKLAGKAITKLLLHLHRHHRHPDAGRFPVDPLSLSFYRRDDVEFSCSNTPSPVSFFLSERRLRRRRGDLAAADAAALALDFGTLVSVAASPAPATLFWHSPVEGRLRITDSPFPSREDEEEDGGRVDLEAEAFIRRFHEQLRMQRSLPATPERRDSGAA